MTPEEITPEEELQIVRRNGIEYLDEIERYVVALKSEFTNGTLTPIYVNEKTGLIRTRLDRLDRMARHRQDNLWNVR